MAGKKGKHQKKRRNNNRRRRRPGKVGNPSVGRLIAKGVKSLVSSVPVIGGVLENVADFAFKAFGITKVKSVVSTTNKVLHYSFNEAEVQNTAVCARFHVTPASIVVGSRSCIQIDMGRKVMTQYRDGRVVSITIKIQPINPMGKRGGDWSLAIQPFFDATDAEGAGFKDTWYPTEQGMHHMYLSSTGPASQPLMLTYRPKITDGRAFTFMPLDKPFAEVVIRWEQPIRSAYGAFTAEEFACETIVSGSVEMRTSPSMASTNSGGYTFDTTVVDKLRSVAAFVYSDADNKAYAIRKDETFKCVEGDSSCKITGWASDQRGFTHREKGLEDPFEVLTMET